ncbi:hypothetical protein VB716_14155 [Synechococcus sp. CCY9201]|uniref:hypothetical protein n=1 Tax=unclassified Synechococcus TaxID=2626047 RepID=UPI002AD3E3B8|nr:MULTISPECIES: hypothetical protein [unclassified Synechococcus]MEA5475361.1 hypothetical protein [Synechococcus sp. CCY9201]CAK6690616.1 hypothetical protein IFHNHDMJ_00851 [Synechococcus sp. CBW1107]
MGHGRGEPLRGGDPHQGQLLDWARGLELDVDAAGAREPCLYLIPDYDTQAEAEEILEEVYKAIVEAELDYWHRDTGTRGVCFQYGSEPVAMANPALSEPLLRCCDSGL